MVNLERGVPSREGDRRRTKEEEKDGERRRKAEKDGARRRMKENKGERRRTKENEGERRRRKNEGGRRPTENEGERTLYPPPSSPTHRRTGSPPMPFVSRRTIDPWHPPRLLPRTLRAMHRGRHTSAPRSPASPPPAPAHGRIERRWWPGI